MNKFYLNLAVIAVSVAFGYKATELHYTAKIATMQANAITAQMKAIQEITEQHNKQVSDLERVQNETQAKLNETHSDGNNLDASKRGLQQSFSDSLRSTCDTAKTGVDTTSAAIATNRIVQAKLFESVTNAAVEYAKIADENRVRGLACERQYAVVNETKF